jgi:hypothetical protein
VSIGGNLEAARFLIGDGVDMTRCQLQADGTATLTGDRNVAEFLGGAERAKERAVSWKAARLLA